MELYKNYIACEQLLLQLDQRPPSNLLNCQAVFIFTYRKTFISSVIERISCAVEKIINGKVLIVTTKILVISNA